MFGTVSVKNGPMKNITRPTLAIHPTKLPSLKPTSTAADTVVSKRIVKIVT